MVVKRAVVQSASHSERSGAESRNPVMETGRNATGFLGFARNEGSRGSFYLAYQRIPKRMMPVMRDGFC